MDTRRELGRLSAGASVAFVRADSGAWGLEIAGPGLPRLAQPQPIRLEIFVKLDDIRTLAAGYKSVEVNGHEATARGEIAYGPGVVFRVVDRWRMDGLALALRRELDVCGAAAGGFYSGVFLAAPDVSWEEAQCFAPGVIYGAPINPGAEPTRGFQNHRIRHIPIREDGLAAPLVALAFPGGGSLAALDPAPRGDTTLEEVGLKQASVMLDGRYQFGALGAREAADGGVELGFWLPGAVDATGPGSRSALAHWQPATGGAGVWPERRRYHRICDGFKQNYQVAFRVGRGESFRDLIRNAWRWAWDALNPPVIYTDVEVVRRSLADQLASTIETIEGRTGITWIFSSTTGRRWNRPDDMRAVLGFVGKNIEAADQLLQEADRDGGPRGERLRALGLAIIDTFIRLVPLSPPAGEGFDLATGEIMVSFPPSPWRGDAAPRVFLRSFTEDLRMALRAYQRERRLGRDHPDWLAWCRSFADWLLQQQREDGSFPRAWVPGTGEVMEASGTSSYNAVPFLALLSQATGEGRYLSAALRAAEYIWSVYGAQGVFVGGTIDNPDVVDKEAGALTLEAFITLYEATQDPQWLERARVAADYTETWIYIWNVPMPEDAKDDELKWKRGVPTYGLQGITAGPWGGVDEYLDWSTAAYAKLYQYTGDPHYKHVALILLHDTKAMLALPGRTYGLAGPGWQQEHWLLGPQRGIGGHGGWLGWVTANHLYSITGLEEFDPELFAAMCKPGR